MSRKIRFAIVGCGNIAKVHAQAIRAIEDAELIAVSSRSKKKAQDFSKDYFCECCDDYEGLLKRPDIDIVNICLPSGLHADAAIKAAKAGKHVIVEKPMDVTLEKADAMIQVFKDRELKLGVVFQRRFEDDMLKARQILEEKKLGKICFVGCYIKWYRSQDYYDSGAWRGTWEFDGGGVLMNQSIHYVDLMQYLLGPIKEVYAHWGTFAHDRLEVEDQVVATIKYENGALGLIEATTNAYPGLEARIDIYGSEGSLVIENDSISSLNLKNEERLMAKSKGSGEGASNPHISFKCHQKQFEQMIQAIKGKEDLQVDGVEGRKALEIVLAIYKSAFFGKAVKLPLENSNFIKEVSKRPISYTQVNKN